MLQKVEPWLLPLEETVHNAEYLCSMEATLAYEERQEGTASFWPPDQGEPVGFRCKMAFGRLKESLVTALRDYHKKQVWAFPFCLLRENKYSVKIAILVWFTY